MCVKYFAISFPNSTTLIMKSDSVSTVKGVVGMLYNAKGLLGLGGTALNPSQFISVESISSPDARQLRVARDLDKVLF